MREGHDIYGKRIVSAVLERCGVTKTEYEIAATDAQSADVYFIPDPAKVAELRALGWFGRVAELACLIELHHRTPDVQGVRDNLRKQLTFDHGRALDHEKVVARSDARNDGSPRPALPPIRLWIITTGRPSKALRGFGMRRIKGWPRGFYTAAPELHLGIVVLRELPRTPDTLYLRLLGRGSTLRRALEDLRNLPADAPGYEQVIEALVAARLVLAQDPNPDVSTRSFLMETMESFDIWKARLKAEARGEGEAEGRVKGLAEGRVKGEAEGRVKGEAEGRVKGEAEGRVKGEVEGLVKSLLRTHATRFGPLPDDLRRALEPLVTDDTIASWVLLFATAPSSGEIAAAILRGTAAP